MEENSRRLVKRPITKEWVKKVSDSRQYRCTVCHKTLCLSSVGWASLTEHANGVKHKDALDKRQNFFDLFQKMFHLMFHQI